MYEKDICGFSFVNYRRKIIFTYKIIWGVRGAKPPSRQRRKISKIEITLEGRWEGVYSVIECKRKVFKIEDAGNGDTLNIIS